MGSIAVSVGLVGLRDYVFIKAGNGLYLVSRRQLRGGDYDSHRFEGLSAVFSINFVEIG